jgi:phage I-like protein
MPDISEKLSFTLEQELGMNGMEVPSEVQVLPSGEVSPKGKTKFLVDEDSRKMIMDAFAGNKTDLVIDYEHQSLSGSEAPAAGWIKDITDRGDLGLWAKVQWTERAKEYLQNREYRYLSPVVLIRKKDGRAVELLGAALTNLPAIDGMTPVVNRVDPGPVPEPSDDRPYKDLFIGVLKIFELPAGADLDDVQAKVTALQDPEGLVPKSEFLALKETLKTIEAEAMIKEALSLGKITPSLVSWARAYVASDPAGFREVNGRACPVVPLKATAGASSAPLLHRSQREVNRLLGISDESYIRNSSVSAPGSIAR